MSKFNVMIREVHINHVEVEADTEWEAKEVANANSVSQSLYVEYSHTMDQDTWTVERKDRDY